VLVNLLSNAVKFTPRRGRVDAAAAFEGDDLAITVSDTGIGIPEDDQEKIFHEFYQVDGSYARKYEGTGLGLALVRRMMSAPQRRNRVGHLEPRTRVALRVRLPVVPRGRRR
jgi:signal transduction histidine kinase